MRGSKPPPPHKKNLRLTRRHSDIFWILADTLLMCDSEGQMGKAEGEANVKATERNRRTGRGKDLKSSGESKVEREAENGRNLHMSWELFQVYSSAL